MNGEREMQDEYGAIGDPRRCPHHPSEIISSADGMFDGVCGGCESEQEPIDLSISYMNGADLSGTYMTGADLSGAYFRDPIALDPAKTQVVFEQDQYFSGMEDIFGDDNLPF